MFEYCADPSQLSGLTWLSCYLTTGTHFNFYWSFLTVLMLLAVTAPVALAFGAGALIVAVAGWSVPILSVGALLAFWAGFLAWWLIGWAIHHIASPDGVALLSAILGYRYVRHEQRARLARMKGGRE